MPDSTDMEQIKKIVFTIERHLGALKKAMIDIDVEAIETAADEIAGLADMIQDAI